MILLPQVEDSMLVEEDYAADEDEYFNYSENLALNDALHEYCELSTINELLFYKSNFL